MEQELSLNEKVDLLLSKVETDKEEKPQEWKIPWLTRFKSNVWKKKIEKGWATIIIIRNNRNLQFTRAEIKDGIAIIDGFPRVCTADHTLFYKRKPFYIIPEWSLKPFSPSENIEQSQKEKMNLAGRRAILTTLMTEKITPKKDFGNIGWIIVVAIVIGAGWYFGKQLGWF